MYVSGRPCLNFCGTLKFRGDPKAEELLTEPHRLSDWAIGAGLVDAVIEVNLKGVWLGTKAAAASAANGRTLVAVFRATGAVTVALKSETLK